jgi:hypothetical protein
MFIASFKMPPADPSCVSASSISHGMRFLSSLLCKILGFHGSDYEKWRLQGCDAVWLL